ncbi:hypothetical protein D9Q98_009409 [Chlorella vulgaris]|uniref:Uncharacterized protein n=1 Tax=Chlorella vulgaris TaxID=3077 RepID=A0A9D4YSF0_CHLVU|nr:hypothetical protein D9Q98_010693 [Chlorella vulgaris]KAI3431008.1 hypothetical protein D9Q98_009409 [Chlorella vulgaris]
MKAVSSVSLRCTPVAPAAPWASATLPVVLEPSSVLDVANDPAQLTDAGFLGGGPCTRFTEMHATGKPQPPLWCQTAPAAYSHGCGQHFSVAATRRNVNADVAAWLCGLAGEELEQVGAALWALHAACPGFRGAIAAATASLSPATAAATMLNLTAQYSGLLSAVAPGGSSLVVLLPTGIDALLERCISCSRLLVADEQHHAAFEAATAAATLLSNLRFGTAAAAETYSAAWNELRLVVTATASSPATTITSEAVLGLWEACARTPFVTTPWLGYRFQAAVDARIAAGWDTAECALRFAEAWACLIARKRLNPTAARSAAVMAAVDSHPLTLQQLRRADALLRLLPGVQTH